MAQMEEHLFGIPLSTHRTNDSESDSMYGAFPYELFIAAISVVMFRTTIPASTHEPIALRWFFAALLGFLAYSDKSYTLIGAVELFSYAVPVCLYSHWPLVLVKNMFFSSRGGKHGDASRSSTSTAGTAAGNTAGTGTNMDNTLRLSLIAFSAVISLFLSDAIAHGYFIFHGSSIFVTKGKDILASLIPTIEVQAAYDILDQFVSQPGLLRHQVQRLLFVTFHIQCGIGYLGIAFLKEEQNRRNQLVRMDMTREEGEEDNTTTNDNSKSTNTTTTKLDRRMKKVRSYQRTAAPFILYTAVPYMIKIIGYGNLNAFAFHCFRDDIHRAVRLEGLFEHDSHLVAVAEHSATSPEAFAGYMDTIVGTTYDLFNRKLFSLPKVLLLPTVMARQPKMMIQIFPIIFLTDWIKGRAVSYMTSRIETLQKETQELSSIRSKVEAFDIKNAELLQRAGPGATDFTRRRWEELTVQVQMKNAAKELTSRTKGFFAFIQRNFVFTVLVDCALAHLIAAGKLIAADVFVFSRAIEDAVDMVLMKSRSEAELARMMTQIDKMKELAQVWDNAKSRNLINCNVASPLLTEKASEKKVSMVTLRNLLYSRGTAMVRVDHLELQAGVYALTGANGSGKSTLFRVLMSCDTNERSIDLPSSIVLSTPNEPIIEADDMQRELACETADEAKEEGDSVDGDATVNMEVTPEGKMIASVDETHPRLSITMPSAHVVEISQTFYWPLYTKPIDWIYQGHVTETHSAEEVQQLARLVAEQLHSLEFAQSRLHSSSSSDEGEEATSQTAEEVIQGIMDELVEEKEDWFSDMSGGQRSKVELTRTVFLKEQCPHVLLVDETMAPLDPRSKTLVMGKLKEFCSGSVVIVIYHTDVGRETKGETGDAVECVPSNDFFDANIHVENKLIHVRPVC